MTNQGSAQGRFQRAIQRRNIFQAELAARELDSLSLTEALSLCLLYEAEQDPRFELGDVTREVAAAPENLRRGLLVRNGATLRPGYAAPGPP